MIQRIIRYELGLHTFAKAELSPKSLARIASNSYLDEIFRILPHLPLSAKATLREVQLDQSANMPTLRRVNMMPSDNHDDDANGDNRETNRGLSEVTSEWSIPKDRFYAYIDYAFEGGRINEATRDRLYRCIDISDDAMVVSWFLLQDIILYGDGEQSEEEDENEDEGHSEEDNDAGKVSEESN